MDEPEEELACDDSSLDSDDMAAEDASGEDIDD